MATAILKTGSKWTTDVSIRNHKLTVDEPAKYDGADLGPMPTELLRASLASCSAITVQMYAQRKQWPLDEISVTVEMIEREVDGKKHMLFIKHLSVVGELSEEQISRVKTISSKCPIHKLLAAAHTIETHVD